MNFSCENFNTFTSNKWDKIVNSFDGSTFLHSSIIINYLCAFNKDTRNLSFLIKDDESNYVAAVVLAVSRNKKKNSLSFYDYTCPIPALAKSNKSKRIKLYDFIWEKIREIADEYKVNELKFKLYPINNYSINNNMISSVNTFESVKYLPKIDVVNNLILSLKKSDAELNDNLSKYRRKDIKKSIKNNIKIDIIDNKNTKNIKYEMDKFRTAHLEAAGRITRPIETWNYMELALRRDMAQLFIAKKENDTISYLFCGKYRKSAWGWSQVNKKKFEKETPIRHYLEWFAINYFKSNGFIFYDIGERFFLNSFSSISKKELSISEFKEKFGAEMYPVISFQSIKDHIKTIFKK